MAGAALSRAAYCSTDKEIPYRARHVSSSAAARGGSGDADLFAREQLAVLFVVFADVDQAHFLEPGHADAPLAGQLRLPVSPRIVSGSMRRSYLPKRIAIVVFAVGRSGRGSVLGLLGRVLGHLRLAFIRFVRGAGSAFLGLGRHWLQSGMLLFFYKTSKRMGWWLVESCLSRASRVCLPGWMSFGWKKAQPRWRAVDANSRDGD